MVFVVDTAKPPQGVSRDFIVEVADQGVAGIGGHSGDATCFEQACSLPQEALLWVVGVDFKMLRHSEALRLRAGDVG